MLNAETYLTPEEGIGGRIRAYYEDFYVEELPLILPSGKGPNTWLLIEKIGRNTLDVVLDVARELKISRKRMGFAGMKDKAALTRQWICISNLEPEELPNLEEKLYNVKIIKTVKHEKKLRIGQLLGNKFRILIRDSENPVEDALITSRVLSQLSQTGVLNYYGWQRFGKNRPNTHIVGKHLVQNDLRGAVDSYIGDPYPEEAEHIKRARELYDEGEYGKALESMPSGMRYEKMMLRELIKVKKTTGEIKEDSYKKALESLPKPLKRMFVHAYQSFLFNKVVSERAKLGVDRYVEGDIVIDNHEHLIHQFQDKEIDARIKNFQAHPTSPLYGSKVPLAGGAVGVIEKRILARESIKLDQFTCTKMPKMGSHGLRRAIRFKIWNTSSESTDEGVLVGFSIPKGCYATAVLREIMKVEVY